MTNYKYHQRVIIDIKSNNKARLEKASHAYWSMRLLKKENNPEDLENYVSINTTSKEVEEI